MGDKTKISWSDATWNPIRGCSRVSEGCRYCYAETMALRVVKADNARGVEGKYHGTVKAAKDGTARWTGKMRLDEADLELPVRWKRSRMIFVNSMSDLFHEKVPDAWIDQVFHVMQYTPHHRYQILTKRPERMRQYLSDYNRRARGVGQAAARCIVDRLLADRSGDLRGMMFPWPWPHVWIGVSVEDTMTAAERIPILLTTPADVRWVSYEPALGPVWWGEWIGGIDAQGLCQRCHLPRGCPDTTHVCTREWDGLPYLDWVVIGGESGGHARPFKLEWARETIEQCQRGGTKVFMKQLGSNPECAKPFFGTSRQGADPAEWPEDLRIQQFPG